MKVEVYIKPDKFPSKTFFGNEIRIYYNEQWIDFRGGKIFIKHEREWMANCSVCGIKETEKKKGGE